MSEYWSKDDNIVVDAFGKPKPGPICPCNNVLLCPCTDCDVPATICVSIYGPLADELFITGIYSLSFGYGTQATPVGMIGRGWHGSCGVIAALCASNTISPFSPNHVFGVYVFAGTIYSTIPASIIVSCGPPFTWSGNNGSGIFYSITECLCSNDPPTTDAASAPCASVPKSLAVRRSDGVKGTLFKIGGSFCALYDGWFGLLVDSADLPEVFVTLSYASGRWALLPTGGTEARLVGGSRCDPDPFQVEFIGTWVAEDEGLIYEITAQETCGGGPGTPPCCPTETLPDTLHYSSSYGDSWTICRCGNSPWVGSNPSGGKCNGVHLMCDAGAWKFGVDEPGFGFCNPKQIYTLTTEVCDPFSLTFTGDGGTIVTIVI